VEEDNIKKELPDIIENYAQIVEDKLDYGKRKEYIYSQGFISSWL
jgi:hypothetical protein